MTDTTDISAPKIVRGTVKWFDPTKGFGFVMPDDQSDDVLLHVNVLRNFGQSTVIEGALVEMSVQASSRGQQAVEIISIVRPETAPVPPLDDIDGLTYAELSNVPVEPARVKWFDKAKGFGFANVFGSDQDVFIHIEVLRLGGMSDLQSGEAIGVRLIDGARGKMAAEVVSWETVIK